MKCEPPDGTRCARPDSPVPPAAAKRRQLSGSLFARVLILDDMERPADLDEHFAK